jgi:hypothetical protein
MSKAGLDGRARDNDGQIRRKSGATKISTLVKDYPELDVLTQNATLKGVERRHGLDGLDAVRRFAKEKRKGR